MRTKLNLQKVHLYLIGILLLTFLLRIPSLYEPFWYTDENIYYFVANGLNKGLALYKNLFEISLPFKYYLLAYILKALGPTLWSARIFLSYWVCILELFMYLLGKKFVSPNVGLIAALITGILLSNPYLEGFIFNNEIIYILPVVVGFWLFVKERLLLSGLMFGLAFLTKFPAIFEFMGLITYCIFWIDRVDKKLTKIKPLLLGFSTPLLLTAFFFTITNNISYLLEATLSRNINYISATNQLLTPFDLLFLKFVALILITLLGFKLLKKSGKPWFINLTLLWLLFTLLGAVFSGKSYTHYLIPSLIPLSFLISYSVCKLISFKTLGIVLSLAILYLGINGFFVLPQRYFYNLSYYPNFFNYILGRLDASDYYDTFDKRVNTSLLAASIVKEKTQDNAKVFVWGDNPEVYFMSGREPATRFSVAYHVLESKSFQDQVIKKLNSEPPEVIIVNKDYPILLPGLANVIENKYNSSGVSGNLIIYKRLLAS